MKRLCLLKQRLGLRVDGRLRALHQVLEADHESHQEANRNRAEKPKRSGDVQGQLENTYDTQQKYVQGLQAPCLRGNVPLTA